ncbi:MAG: viroplasmin family protein [Methanomicrobiales archaeon]|jgi:ribonuclease HI|nr:viroplasmin family protein [Methanomicrobiales archaeon]
MSYYTVKAGYTTGIFDNWDECKKATHRYPDADFKKFTTLAEAEAYMNDLDVYDEIIKKDISNGYIVAFCDGSYDKIKSRYSYGVVIIDRDFQEHEIYDFGEDNKYISSNNIVGEVLGVIKAMDWAVSHNYDTLKIYHDYEGLSKWLSGEWKAKSDVAAMFVSEYTHKYADLIQVEFEKVKSHNNNKYNCKADQLAKRAQLNGSYARITGNNWFSIPYFEEEILQTILDLMLEKDPGIQIEKSDNTNFILVKLKLAKNKLSVKLFKGGKESLVVQGANSALFQMFITYINELIPVNEKDVFSHAYKKEIDTVKIDAGMQAICPEFPVDYPENIKRLIRQSLINLNYFEESEDYSQYVFPAFRALEGHMRYLLGKTKNPILSKRTFGIFKKNKVNNAYYLPKSVHIEETTKEKLEECYNFYNANRHTLFHFGEIIGDTAGQTRFIETKDEADELIKKCLSYI